MQRSSRSALCSPFAVCSNTLLCCRQRSVIVDQTLLTWQWWQLWRSTSLTIVSIGHDGTPHRDSTLHTRTHVPSPLATSMMSVSISTSLSWHQVNIADNSCVRHSVKSLITLQVSVVVCSDWQAATMEPSALCELDQTNHYHRSMSCHHWHLIVLNDCI